MRWEDSFACSFPFPSNVLGADHPSLATRTQDPRCDFWWCASQAAQISSGVSGISGEAASHGAAPAGITGLGAPISDSFRHVGHDFFPFPPPSGMAGIGVSPRHTCAYVCMCR